MKKLLLLTALILASVVLFSQVIVTRTGGSIPQFQQVSSPSTQFHINGMAYPHVGFINSRYLDTASANASLYIKWWPGAQIITGNKVWVRDSVAQKWLEIAIFGGGGSPMTNIYNSDGTLTGNRTLNGNLNTLGFTNLSGFILNVTGSTVVNSSGLIELRGTTGVFVEDNLDVGKVLTLPGDNSPTTITADQNNYNPTNMSEYEVLRISSDAARTITGLMGTLDGRTLILHNVGSFDITLSAENLSSDAVNRFAFAADIVLQPTQSLFLIYDATSLRWRAPSAVGGGGVIIGGSRFGVSGEDATATQNRVFNGNGFDFEFTDSVKFAKDIMIRGKMKVGTGGIGALNDSTGVVIGWTAGRDMGLSGGTFHASVAIGSQGQMNRATSIGNTSIGFRTMTWGDFHPTLPGYGPGTATATLNTQVGSDGMYVLRDGGANTGIGYKAFYNLSDGDYNNAHGTNALRYTTNGSFNQAYGQAALHFATTTACACVVNAGGSGYTTATGTATQAAGYFATGDGATIPTMTLTVSAGAVVSCTITNVTGVLTNNTVTVTGDGTGASVSLVLCSADENTGMGHQVLYNNSIGDGNAALGFQAGWTAQFNKYNTLIGYKSGYWLPYDSNMILIGATPTSANVTGDTTLSGIYINKNTHVGWWNQDLNVRGRINFSGPLMPNNLAGTAGQVLTSGGAGVPPTWAAAGGVADGDKGDITVSASGATWTIDNLAVTDAKINDVAVGKITGITGTPDGAKFLRDDFSWQTPPVTLANTVTLTNKRITPRVTTVASSATPTPDGDASDLFTVTALAEAATFGAPTGTPTNGQYLLVRIKDNGTARALSFNAIYRASTDFALPTTTVISKTLYLQFIYNSADSKWDAVGYTDGF